MSFIKNNFHFKLTICALVIFCATLSYQLLYGSIVEEVKKLTAAPIAKDESGCVSCHSNLPAGNSQVLESTWQADTHHKAGIACVTCHNGDPDPSIKMANWKDAHQSSKEKKFIGKVSKKDQPEFCGSCHENASKMKEYHLTKEEPVTGIKAIFASSKHSVALSNGDEASASCASCHGAHGAMKASEVSSKTYPKNISNMCGSCHSNAAYMKESLAKAGKEFEDHSATYMQSVHAAAVYVKNDLGSPTCNDCHSNHGDHLAEVATVSESCTTCHSSVATAFNSGPHQATYAANGYNGCVTCHGSPNGHAIAKWNNEKVGAQDGAQCTNCHNSNVPDALSYKVDVESYLKSYNAISLTYGNLASQEDSLKYATERGFFAGLKFRPAPLQTAADSMKIAAHWFTLERYRLALDNQSDSARALQLAPEILKYADPNKVATATDDSTKLALAVEVSDYASGVRRYNSNLRALGSATKLHAELNEFERTYTSAKAFFKEREAKGDYVKPEEEYLSEFKRAVDESRTVHHSVRAAVFNAKMEEGYTMRDSVNSLVTVRTHDAAGKKTIMVVVVVLTMFLVGALATKVSKLNHRDD